MALERDRSVDLGRVFLLVEAALGLSLLSHYDCAAVINNPEDRATATDGPVIALVPLLREARDLLNKVL